MARGVVLAKGGSAFYPLDPNVDTEIVLTPDGTFL